MPNIIVKFNGAVVGEYELGTEMKIGRKANNDIVIDNPAVSGHHCRIVLKGETYSIEDLESTNGTFVNDKKIQRTGLHHNDIIGIAKHRLTFQEHAEAGKKKAAPPEKVGLIRVLEGAVNGNEFKLKGLSTYIGKADRAQIHIKSAGLFGSAPDIAASVHRKGDGYVLVAVEEGYPTINDVKVKGQQPLKDGDIIKCGATTFQFALKKNA